MWGRLSADNMESWDEAKLEEVVDQKHGESNKKMPQTAIVSHIVPLLVSLLQIVLFQVNPYAYKSELKI